MVLAANGSRKRFLEEGTLECAWDFEGGLVECLASGLFYMVLGMEKDG